MKNDVKQNLQQEVLISCLDVLCRANATLFESDPKLAADISQAIESLSAALQNDDSPAMQADTPQCGERYLEPADFCKKNILPGYFPSDDVIVDVLTNEVIRRPPGK